MNATTDVVQLYTARSQRYLRFVNAVGYPQGICAYFLRSKLIQSGLDIMDAGCGTGIASLALRKAMLKRGLQPVKIRCFDVTPAMLQIFHDRLHAEAIRDIETAQADVLDPESFPAHWRDFDLIISAAMLEYIPVDRLVEALSNLRSRLRDSGALVLFITRKNVLMKYLIGEWWKANCYSQAELAAHLRQAGFARVTFSAFPLPYKHLSLWGHIVEAKTGA